MRMVIFNPKHIVTSLQKQQQATADGAEAEPRHVQKP